MDEQLAELKNADRSLFPSNFTVQALRDSRYHNTAYAIAELIDNSIEAEAGRIDFLCMEEPQSVGSQTRRRISGVAILDDGEGMGARTLLEALRFGGGTRHNSDRGIGKYGMGLPTSSMSQCKRVDVWTWQDGLDSAWHANIDADDIANGNHEVPVPDREPIPDTWRTAGNDEIYGNRTGTLVVWSKLDKVQWKTSRAIIDNTSREVGRIHRHWIEAEMTKIRVVSFLANRPTEPDSEPSYIVANDPLYLMKPTSTPRPWDDEAMFREWCPPREYNCIVEDREQTIRVKYSIVKPEALKTDRVTQNPGNEAYGKHARHNIGVSVVREYREIVLEDAFLREGGSTDLPQNRWWGCEVEFFRGCDELFGVDHNKQMVANFTQAAKTLTRDERRPQIILEEMGIDEEDIIHKIVGDIRDQTRAMMDAIRQMFEQRRNSVDDGGRTSGRRNPEDKAARIATDADRDAIAAGEEQRTKTDRDREQIPSQDRQDRLTEQFIESGQPEQDAEQRAKLLIQEDLSYQFSSEQGDGFQIFKVRSYQGILHIKLNTEHPIYDLLKHIEDELPDDADESDPRFQASVAIRLLLSSWARMEDQTEAREERARIQDTAMNWGRQVDKAIRQLRDRNR